MSNLLKGERGEKKIATVINLIIIIFAYSAIKIIANPPPLYSTLNPETSSDSPSARSNGVRFVSARIVINHATKIGIVIKYRGVLNSEIIEVKLYVCGRHKAARRISAILTS